MSIASSQKLILPVMADNSSRRAIMNAFSLIYSLKLPSDIYTQYAFKHGAPDKIILNIPAA